MKNKTLIMDCNIMRTVVITHSTFNMVTGESLDTRQETVTEPCGTPLFSDIEMSTGICNSCRNGWETDGNIFADEKEKERATKNVKGV